MCKKFILNIRQLIHIQIAHRHVYILRHLVKSIPSYDYTCSPTSWGVQFKSKTFLEFENKCRSLFEIVALKISFSHRNWLLEIRKRNKISTKYWISIRIWWIEMEVWIHLMFKRTLRITLNWNVTIPFDVNENWIDAFEMQMSLEKCTYSTGTTP